MIDVTKWFDDKCHKVSDDFLGMVSNIYVYDNKFYVWIIGSKGLMSKEYGDSKIAEYEMNEFIKRITE